MGPSNLSRVNGRRTVTLNVILPTHVTLEEALQKLEAEAFPVIEAELPPGGAVKYRGNADAVQEAIRIRARPIFMSSLTSVFGMLPLMLLKLKTSAVTRVVLPARGNVEVVP